MYLFFFLEIEHEKLLIPRPCTSGVPFRNKNVSIQELDLDWTQALAKFIDIRWYSE